MKKWFLLPLLSFSLEINTFACDQANLSPSPIKKSIKEIIRADEKEVRYTQTILGNIDPTNQYEELSLYQVPVIHPYDATGEDSCNWRIHCGVPTYLFFAKVPTDTPITSLNFFTAFLGDVYTNLRSEENVDVFICVQNNPWKKEKLLLRPHYWVFGSQPNIASTNLYKDKSIQARILSKDTIKLDKQNENELLQDSIAIHVMDRSYKKIISSADNLEILGLPQEQRSVWFWSHIIDRGNILVSTTRQSLTLNVMLDDKDFNTLSGCANDINDTPQLLEKLKSFF